MTESEENQALEGEIHVASPGSLMESRTSQLDDVLSGKLEAAFHKETSQVMLHEVAKIGSEYDPIDLAFAVSRLPPSARVVVYENLPDLEAKVIFLINTGSNTRTAIFRHISNQEITELLTQMPPDEAVWILDDMSDRRMKNVMRNLPPDKRTRILELQRHDRDSAGRLMTDECFAFHMNTKVGEVSRYIRDHPGIELTKRIFVLNDEAELIGYVPDRNLIVNAPETPIRQVMRPIFHTVTPDSSRDEVVDLVERYKIPALPVVNELNQLVGVITYDTVVEAMEDIADETIASIGGTAEDVSEHEPILKRCLWRSPWLLVTMCAGLLNATALAHFDGRVWFALVPLFVPLISGMSGNVGIQCSTVLVRAMSTGELSAGTKNDAMRKELTIGLLIGIAFGLFCGVVIFLLNQFEIFHQPGSPLVLGATVSFGVLGACLTATVLGTFSPFFFARLRIDPAVASGPIVTAFNDVVSILIFFVVARGVNLLFAAWSLQ